MSSTLARLCAESSGMTISQMSTRPDAGNCSRKIQAVGQNEKTVNGIGGALGGPVTAYLYDWNMLPIGQQLWYKELMSFKEFPPMQAPET
jgi:hypothetical protein